MVYDGMTLNGSREYHTFSDFSMNDERDVWPTPAQQYEYVCEYARHNQLDKYIKLQHEVVSVRPSADHETTKTWMITWRHGDVERTQEFDGVIICSGRYTKPILPKIAGQDRFQGVYHAANRYRHNQQEEVKNKRVLVLGNSLTAGDIAEKIAEAADTVSGLWINKTFLLALPFQNSFSLLFVIITLITLDTKDFCTRMFRNFLKGKAKNFVTKIFHFNMVPLC